MQRWIGLTVLAVFCAMFLPAEAFSKTSEIKLAFLGRVDPHKAAYSTGVVNFSHMVEKMSAERMSVRIFPGGTLGDETDILQAVRSNAVQMTLASMVTLSRIFPPAELLMAPYIFKNEAIAWEVVDGPFGRKILDSITEKTGLKALAIMDTGFLAISNNRRPLRTLDDFRGVKFRAMGPLQANMFKALGASGVPVPWPETYTSLQTGVVEGQTNAPFVVEVFKIYEVQKYLSLTNSQFGYQIWLCNKAWYDSLSEADKAVIRDAVEAGRISTRGMALLREQESIEQLKKEGMKVNSLTAKEIEALQAAARPAGIEWLKSQMDPAWVDEMMTAISAAEKKLGY